MHRKYFGQKYPNDEFFEMLYCSKSTLDIIVFKLFRYVQNSHTLVSLTKDLHFTVCHL